jgi:scyllo-inositol 2-dehydrogenase (NADP+)
MKLRVGVIGFGKSARVFHCPLIAANPQLELASVVERHSEESGKRFPGVVVRHSAEELARDPAIDLVVIAVPNAEHFALARTVLEAGKHVIVEKPFTVTVREADELIDLASTRGRVLSVYHNRRWDGDFLTVRRILEGRLLGGLVEYESHFDRFRPALRAGSWRESEAPGSGLVYDLGSHLIDQALTLFGRPVSVSADLRTQRPAARVVDFFSVELGYPDMRATLKASLLAREPRPRFLLNGALGSFIKEGYDVQEERLIQGHSPLEENWGAEDEDRWGLLNTEVGGVHVRGKVETLRGDYPGYYRNVFEAINGTAPLEVTAEQARDCIRVIELAIESSRTGAVMRYSN